MNKIITECIGTFFLVLTIGCTVIGTSPGAIPPLAIGAILMVMIFAGGHISGAHYNPAVTLGLVVRGRCSRTEAVGYISAQIVGALFAAPIVGFLKSGAQVAAMTPDLFPAILAEFLFTYALVYVVLNVATAKGTEHNSFYGLAIGATVMAGAFAVGNISGGAFNPAVALGLTAMGVLAASNIWSYVVAHFVAGIAAGITFRVLNKE
jgi:aquaporin Z